MAAVDWEEAAAGWEEEEDMEVKAEVVVPAAGDWEEALRIISPYDLEKRAIQGNENTFTKSFVWR